jgi:tyrosinase
MVDRTWWIWQNQKVIRRAFMVNGTRTMFNNPPSDEATMEDIIDMAFVTPTNASTYAMKNHVSSVAGPYCYVYM